MIRTEVDNDALHSPEEGDLTVLVPGMGGQCGSACSFDADRRGNMLSVLMSATTQDDADQHMTFDLKSYDYAIHPIFSPFFVFSNRRKRKMKLTPHQLISLVDDPRTAIRQILRQHKHEDDAPLPEQLQLFANFYR